MQLIGVPESAPAQAFAAMAELRRLAGLATAWDWSRCAVIACEWRYLQPVRACAELLGVPVQVADEEAPPFWRLRETQALLRWLRAPEQHLIDAGLVAARLVASVANPWNVLLREAADDYALEVGNLELPTAHFIEWLAEWGREARRRQQGLLLSTAHRAKGLEFDHVIVLDGGWDAQARKDGDAARRLRYVAMTRARPTLAVMQFEPAVLAPLPAPAVLRRSAELPLVLPAALSQRYLRLNAGDVDLSFAGRCEPQDRVHGAIARLAPGDRLEWRLVAERCELVDAQGVIVGRLARAFVIEPGWRAQAMLAALIVRRREDSDEAFGPSLRCDAWEVVLPELVLARQ